MKTSFIIAIFLALALMFAATANSLGYFKDVINPPIKVFDFDKGGEVLLEPSIVGGLIRNLTILHRLSRESKVCKIPKKVASSHVQCKVYPNRVTCIQTCIFGYTLSTGVQREMRCRNEENKWRPVPEFEKCKPFIDCSVTLGPGGKYLCYTNYLDRGQFCDISCSKYEDQKAVPKKSYKCDIKGKWTPKLPFCAKAGSGLELVSPPPVYPEYIKKQRRNDDLTR